MKHESSGRAHILAAIHNAHFKEKKPPRHFDYFERAKAKEEAKKFARENQRTETLSQFIRRNQNARP